MIHRSALDQDVTRDGVLFQVVLLGEALHLLLALLLHWKRVLGLDVQLGSLSARSRSQQRHRTNDQDPANVLTFRHILPRDFLSAANFRVERIPSSNR